MPPPSWSASDHPMPSSATNLRRPRRAQTSDTQTSASPAFRRATTAHSKKFTSGALRRQRVEAEIPGILPYVLLGAALVSSLAMPLYVFFCGGLPEPNMSLTPPVAGTHHPTRAVHDNPREGTHFEPGVLHAEGRALGEHWAPYYVVEFTDFFCEHCQEAHRAVTSQDWVVYGKVRLESHPVAFLEDDSLRAAHAALCAQEQHKYWEVRELLLQVPLSWQQEHQNGSVFNAPTLRRLAVLAGLDLASFARCFRSGRHAVEVHRVSKLARQMRVYATPSFIVGRTDMSHKYDERYENGGVFEGSDALTREKLTELIGPPGPWEGHPTFRLPMKAMTPGVFTPQEDDGTAIEGVRGGAPT